MIKIFDPVSESDVLRHQNKRETRAYLESREREQDFIAPVLCGSTDYDWIVTKKLQKLDPGQVQTEVQRPTQRHGSFRNQSTYDGVIPEGWIDRDGRGTQYGFDEKAIKVLDGGMLEPEDEWTVNEPEERPETRIDEVTGSEYFQIIDTEESYSQTSEASEETEVVL